MKKLFSFLDKWGVLIIIVLLLFVWIRSCSNGKRLTRVEKTVDTKVEKMARVLDSSLADKPSVIDLRIEGLRAEKRAIQACDRRKFDLDREIKIDEEIASLEALKK